MRLFRDPLIHIVLPLYNEEKVLTQSVTTLISFLQVSEFPYRYLITLANNASTDGSVLVAGELAKRYSQIRVLNLDLKGKGHAVKTAWANDEGDILSFMDVDLASDLNFFRRLIDGVAVEGYDLVIGNRLGTESVITNRRFHRHLVSRFYNFLVRLFLKTGIEDHQCGFKAIRRDSFRAIESLWEEKGFFFDTELLVLCRRNNMKIFSIDIVWNDKQESKVELLKDSVKMFFNIIRLRGRLHKITRRKNKIIDVAVE